MTAQTTATDEPLGHRLDGERGEVVLTLNGGMMTYGSWAPVSDHLGDEYRLLGCDFRGQLRSPGAAHPNIADNVGDVVALLDALGLEKVHVLGTSFGAEVGLVLAAEHPQRVRSLAAVTAVDRTPPGMAENSHRLQVLARRTAEGEASQALHDALVEDIYSASYRAAHRATLAERGAHTAALPKAWYEGLTGILTAVADFDLTPYLQRIVCPTLVVHAAQDRVMPLARVRALADGIRNAEWRRHPTSGHALVVEDPAWLGRLYGRFLADLTPT